MFRKMSAWRNKRKHWKSVNNGTSFHISPTADVSLVPAVFVLFWVTVETQRSGEKANVSGADNARGALQQCWFHSEP